MKQLLIPGLILLLTPLAALAQPAWKPTKTAVTFTIRNAGFNVDGSFSGFAGVLAFDPAAPDKAQLTATVETATLNTGNGLRDGHLKKPDYFDVATFPRISLKSVRVAKSSTNAYVGTFDLTIKTTTRPVQIPFTFAHTGKRAPLPVASPLTGCSTASAKRVFCSATRSASTSKSTFRRPRLPLPTHKTSADRFYRQKGATAMRFVRRYHRRRGRKANGQ